MKIPVSGLHHITLVGSNRQDTIDFYEGVLGMPLILEQPNLDVPEESHIYFDAGDGKLITFFVREDRATNPGPTPEDVGAVHHIAYTVSPEVIARAEEGLADAEYANSGIIDRGFMDSLYFRDPNGFRIELSAYKFEPPEGRTHAHVLADAHRLRVNQGEYNVTTKHLEEAGGRIND